LPLFNSINFVLIDRINQSSEIKPSQVFRIITSTEEYSGAATNSFESLKSLYSKDLSYKRDEKNEQLNKF